ncbi:MAG: poly-beta-1,6-N-acetyl-D-glucosamine N-deacetylase PgaB [Methylococcaceae bacterium]
MYRFLYCFLALSILGFGAVRAESTITVLAYHDVADQTSRQMSVGNSTVSTENLRAQFEWLKTHHYEVIGIQALVDAREGKRKLPEKAVILSFDDGYASVYDKVYPLLQAYHYPALIALVGRWLEVEDGLQVPFSERETWPREHFLSWKHIREMIDSGWVEVASHSHDAHRGIPGDPALDLQPAYVTRLYSPVDGTYENDAAYARRLREEMRQSSDSIYTHLGVRPRVMVWPYGHFNQPALDAAAETGMNITFGLDDGHNTLADLPQMKRMLITDNPSLDDFAAIMTTERENPVQRVAHVDLDYVYDENPAQLDRNLRALTTRIKELDITAVYLEAYADPDGDGNADALYFPNRHLPVRADLFNRVAWRLRTWAHARVYAWMPVLAFQVKASDDWFVHEWKDGQIRLGSHIYKRLSPFHPEARRVIGEIYEDLARYANINGILFHDDAILSDYEDLSPAGLADLATHKDLPQDFQRLHAEPAYRLQWAHYKTRALIDLTDYLTAKVKYYRPGIKTARNFYAEPLIRPHAEEWYAQSFPALLNAYDYVAIEAMPFMEKAADPDRWLKDLVGLVAAHPAGLKKTVFELQTVDWNTQTDIPMNILMEQVRIIRRAGAEHIGYYPDNMVRNHPYTRDLASVLDPRRVP